MMLLSHELTNPGAALVPDIIISLIVIKKKTKPKTVNIIITWSWLKKFLNK